MNEVFTKLGYKPMDWKKSQRDPTMPVTYTAEELEQLDFYQDGSPMLADWLLKERYSIVCARRFTGKTWIVMAVGIAVAGGGTLFDWAADVPRKILLVDGELSRGQIKRNYLHLVQSTKGMHRELVRQNLKAYPKLAQTPNTLLHPLETKRGRDDVLRVAREWGAELIILDNIKSLTKISDRNSDSKSEPFLDLVMALKAEGRTTLVMHHASAKQNPKSPLDPCMGAGAIGDRADTIIYLRRVGKEDGEARADLTFLKWRDDQDTTPIRFHLSRDTGEWDWSYPTTSDANEEADNDPAVAEALELFHNDACTSVAAMARGHSEKPTRRTFTRWLR